MITARDDPTDPPVPCDPIQKLSRSAVFGSQESPGVTEASRAEDLRNSPSPVSPELRSDGPGALPDVPGTVRCRAYAPAVFTTDEIDSRSAQPTAGDDVQYEFTSARALRGTETRTIAKWERDGWELHTRTPGTVRTELTFRRVKPKNPWQKCVALLAAHWPAFGRLTATTQQFALAAVGGLVTLVLVGAVVAAGVLGGGTAQPAASPTEAVPSEQASEATPSAQPSEAPPPAEAAPEAYTYSGPQYEVVVVDQNVGPAALDQYWVLTSPLAYSTDDYKNQIKLIVEDVARQAGTDAMIVNVVTDREVAEAEAFSTYEQFVAEHGEDYAINTIPVMEREHWVASYTGGFDFDAGEASESAEAFEVIWRPFATQEIEQWKPALGG